MPHRAAVAEPVFRRLWYTTIRLVFRFIRAKNRWARNRANALCLIGNAIASGLTEGSERGSLNLYKSRISPTVPGLRGVVRQPLAATRALLLWDEIQQVEAGGGYIT
jgi:hypothetical protein